MSTGYGWEGLRQVHVCATLLGARHVPEHLCGRVKACPHLFPKRETLYPETGDFVAEQQSRLFPNTHLPFLTMKSPETATKSPVSGYSLLFREQVCTGL